MAQHKQVGRVKPHLLSSAVVGFAAGVSVAAGINLLTTIASHGGAIPASWLAAMAVPWLLLGGLLVFASSLLAGVEAELNLYLGAELSYEERAELRGQLIGSVRPRLIGLALLSGVVAAAGVALLIAAPAGGLPAAAG